MLIGLITFSLTTGRPEKSPKPDRPTIAANGQDNSFVTVSVVDKKGNLCPAAAEQLQFSGKGWKAGKMVVHADN